MGGVDDPLQRLRPCTDDRRGAPGGYRRPARGESWDDLHARVDRVWARVTATAVRQRGDVVVVTHGLVCHSLVARHLALEAGAAEGGFGNTSVTIVEGEPPWRVRLLNCTAHLDTDTAHDTRTRSGL
jgi:broad specificity phosphatase PhoE